MRVLSVSSEDELSGLSLIHNKDINAVIWARNIPETVQNWLDNLSVDELPEGRFVLKAENVGRCVNQLFKKAGHSPTPEQSWLAEDMSVLARQLSQTLATVGLRLRFEAVTGDACRRFHVDDVQARLICSYSGPGTEYGVADDGKLPEQIHRVPTGLPILLKGKQWPESQKSQLLHRSPPIAGLGIVRLVIVLEAAALDTQELSPYDTVFH